MSDSKVEGHALELAILPGVFAVCRFAHDAPLPAWAGESDVVSITRTPEELSVVCEQRLVPSRAQCERDWRCLKVKGPLDLSLIGVLASLAAPLAQAGIPIFALSTFDTDYLLVKSQNLQKAARALRQAGHRI
jgi:hypothetical protein